MSGYNLNLKYLAESCKISQNELQITEVVKKNINFISLDQILNSKSAELSLFDLFSKEDFEKHFAIELEILDF